MSEYQEKKMAAKEILQKWMEYSRYDPNQTRFNLLSAEYELHRCNNNLVKVMEYDPSGALAVMYARNCFKKTLEDKRIKLIDLANNRDLVKAEMEMWDIFNSPDVKAVEDGMLDSFNRLVSQVVGTRMIGERDLEAERNALYSSINAVVEELDKCNVDLFLRGGSIGKIKHFSTHIHVFERLAECLLAIETAKDGMYLCYINNGGTSDGYFGFYIKSNRSILSVNERVNEAYQGQHKNSRNGRWSEAKKFELFPYAHIFSFGDYDYKGYAGKHIIDNEQLAFFNLKPDAYMPLIIAMILLNTKYENADVTKMPIKYLDSLLTVNLSIPTPGVEALAVSERSAIATVNRNFELHMTTESVLNGECAKRLTAKERDYTERGVFPTEPNIFVKLYGAGFTLDTSKLLEANRHLKRLPGPGDDDEDLTPDAEFVGTEARMEVIAYRAARIQLAEYIRDRMFEEYLEFGSREGVERWFYDLLMSNKKRIMSLCVQKYKAVQDETEKTVDSNQLRYINFITGCKGSPNCCGIWGRRLPFNEPHGVDRWGRFDGKYLCPFTGNMASIFFVFRFNNWTELIGAFGEENIPKIVIGWQRDRICVGNPLLDATDAVSEIGTVFEDREISKNRRLWDRNRWSSYFNRGWKHRDVEVPETALDMSPSFGFDFAVGFSKRGLSSLLKESNEKGAKI